MKLFILISFLFSKFIGLDFCFQLHSVNHKQKINVEVFEHLNFLVDLTNEGKPELCLVVCCGKVGLVKHAHCVDSNLLSAKLLQGALLKGFSYVGIQTFYSHCDIILETNEKIEDVKNA